MPPGEPEGVLALQGIGQVQPFQRVGRVVHHHGDVAVTGEVSQFHLNTTPDLKGPVSAAGQGVFIFVHVFPSLCCGAVADGLAGTPRAPRVRGIS